MQLLVDHAHQVAPRPALAHLGSDDWYTSWLIPKRYSLSQNWRLAAVVPALCSAYTMFDSSVGSPAAARRREDSRLEFGESDHRLARRPRARRSPRTPSCTETAGIRRGVSFDSTSSG